MRRKVHPTYTVEEGDDPRWLLYTKPLRLEAGQTKVRAKATRIGYQESREIEAMLLKFSNLLKQVFPAI